IGFDLAAAMSGEVELEQFAAAALFRPQDVKPRKDIHDENLAVAPDGGAARHSAIFLGPNLLAALGVEAMQAGGVVRHAELPIEEKGRGESGFDTDIFPDEFRPALVDRSRVHAADPPLHWRRGTFFDLRNLNN